MIRKSALVLMSLLLVSGAASLFAADTYDVDPSHTAIIFSVSHAGFSYTYGRFNQAGGQFVLDGPNSSFVFEVDAKSLDTNFKTRDDHLRGADFFNVNQFPKITFQSTQVVATSEGMNVTGNLTMHGVTKQVTLPMKQLGQGKGPMGKDRTGFLSQFQVKRSDFGMSGMMGPVGDEVAMSISFEGIKQ